MRHDSAEVGRRRSVRFGEEAVLEEIEHHAEHWEAPDHGETGHLIAEALRTSIDIVRGGGLQCAHRGSRAEALRHLWRADEALLDQISTTPFIPAPEVKKRSARRDQRRASQTPTAQNARSRSRPRAVA